MVTLHPAVQVRRPGLQGTRGLPCMCVPHPPVQEGRPELEGAWPRVSRVQGLRGLEFRA